MRNLLRDLTVLFQLFLLVNGIFLVSIGSMILFWGIKDRMFVPSHLEVMSHTESVAPGDMFVWDVKATRYRKDCSVWIERTMVDMNDSSHIISFPGTERYIYETGTFLNTNSVVIPGNVSPGQWRMEITTRYYCSPWDYLFGPQIIELPPIEFEVLT